jgi:transcriptional regulator with XRE-family HTH domain
MRERVGHRIKVRRVDMKMQQGELAEGIGMKQAQLSEIERGMRPLRVDQLMMIAQVLKCSASHLLGEDKSVA